ncbi:MAG: substrate-binding domain-containing protein [Caldilineales bacterium]|nr:substrate-binding domain-containing protein [Caldilineales bacterium]
MKKLLLMFIIVLAAGLLLAACGGSQPEPTPEPAPTEASAPEPTEATAEPTTAPEPTEATATASAISCDEPIKIGLITDLTGGLAIYGTMTDRGFGLGMEYATGGTADADGNYQVGDCTIQVLLRDDQGSADTTATLARELIDVEDVDILVGTVSSGSTASLQEIAKENEVPLIVAPAAANDITGVNFNEYTFRTSRENYQDFINLCQYLTTQYDTFVQIAPDYSFGYGGAQSARDACTFFGGEFVADDIFAPLDTTEFTPYMEQILDSGADAWLVTWAGGGFIPMFQSAKELGVLDEMGIGASFFDNLTMPAVFGDLIGQTSGILYHYALPDNEINDWLVAEHKARFDTPPDLFTADGMNAALMAIAALEATGGDTSPDALLAAMEGMTFEGPKGAIEVRPEDHVAIQDMYIVKLNNLDDPDFNYYDLVAVNRPQPPCLLPEGMQDRCGDLPIGQMSEVSVAPGEPAVEEMSEPLACDEPIKVGFISDLSGALAIYGAMAQRSFQLGMEYQAEAIAQDALVYKVDDCDIQVFIRDDQGSAETTATLARELIDVEDVDILIGTVSSGSTASLQEIAHENDVVLIVMPAAANDITGVNFNEHTFRTSRENYQDFINLCAYLTTEYDTFVQIAPDYSFGYGGAQSARDACTFYGGEFVADDIFAPLDTTEFTPYMEQILDSGADAWLVTWAGGGFIPMFQTAAELGVLDEMGLGASYFDNRTMAAIFGPVSDKMSGQISGILYHYSAPDNEINDWLVEQIKDRYGEPPDLFDADGMNAAFLLVEGLRASGGDPSSAALIPAMEGLEFEGPKGAVYIRPEDHVAIQDMYIVKLTDLNDPDFDMFELVQTTRPEPPCLLPEGMQDRCGDLAVGSMQGAAGQ